MSVSNDHSLLEAFNIEHVVAIVSLIVSILALGISVAFWRKQFRPIVTASVKTRAGGNISIAYDLVLLNSGAIPARNLRLRATAQMLSNALGKEADDENKSKWLTCFSPDIKIEVIQNGDQLRCSFGYTKGKSGGFWRYDSAIEIELLYEGWFGHNYAEVQTIRIRDSDSFTDYSWVGK